MYVRAWPLDLHGARSMCMAYNYEYGFRECMALKHEVKHVYNCVYGKSIKSCVILTEWLHCLTT